MEIVRFRPEEDRRLPAGSLGCNLPVLCIALTAPLFNSHSPVDAEILAGFSILVGNDCCRRVAVRATDQVDRAIVRRDVGRRTNGLGHTSLVVSKDLVVLGH